MLWNPGSSLMHGSGSSSGDTGATTILGQSRVGNAFLGVLLIIVATVVGAAVYTKSRSKAKRASSLHLASLPSPATLAQEASTDRSYVDQVSEKLQRSLRRLFSRKTAPVASASDVEQRTPSCQCHDGSAPYMLSFHTAFHQQQQHSSAAPAAQESPATGEAVFQISSRLPYNVSKISTPPPVQIFVCICCFE